MILIKLNEYHYNIFLEKASYELRKNHYWYFLNKEFKFQPNVCNGCHDLLMMSMNLSGIAILNIKSADYRCIISALAKIRP